MKFYVAGKISGTAWREALFDQLHESGSFFAPDDSSRLIGGHEYVGPYWTDLSGHGDTGDDGDHSVLGDPLAFADATYQRYKHGGDLPNLQGVVATRCLSQISACDVFFAWIDATDCYGTLVEIGLARGLGKPVWIGMHDAPEQPLTVEDSSRMGETDPLVNLWFAVALASSVEWALSPQRAFERLLTRNYVALLRAMPYAEYLQTAHWQAKRLEALERTEHHCQVCNSDQLLQVHHRTYERRGAERASDLTVLCKGCHERYHVVLNGRATVSVR